MGRPTISAPVLTLVVGLSLLAGMGVNAQPVAGPQGPAIGTMHRQEWLIPMSDQDLMMRATVFRPAGPGPFPLAVVSHGSHQSSVRRAKMPMPEYPVLSQWLVDRGYAVVLPQRFGHGQTGGPYLEDEGRCENPDYRAAGEAAANAIQAAINSLTVAPFVRATDVLAIGHSAGGWGALALAARGQTLTAVINIAGGRGGRMDNKPNTICASDRLVATAAAFGRRSRVPTLWLYAENDSYFPPAVSKRMFEAYRGAGGVAEYRLLPPFGREGHNFIEAEDARALWGPAIEGFLGGLQGRR